MPELPEVEVVRRGLEPLLTGHRIVAVTGSGLPLRQPVPMARLRALGIGARVTAVNRRAKFLLLGLDNGALILIHLGMTGKVYPAGPQTPTRKHDHLCFQLEGGDEVRLNDCRRFGLVAIYPPEEAAAPPPLADLGPEPLDEAAFTAEYLLSRCRGRQTPIKNLLMENRVVVGIGNIYANEILFAVGLNPWTPADAISPAQAREIVDAGREILYKAIAAGGTTIADFANAAGESGYFQVQLAVYGRHGQPCLRCGTVIERRPQAGRPSFYCRRCQPACRQLP
ncbi:bifunctional DNA-formamidopyrimidine glycosylase/DNA-(apurinic or apyrimidinic site) lyase [Desulfurivibrio sp. D14AmB]|uniref:bifunctional DNA-formamidopyrimidine glycosylase/DNA-(apurinic or apyrimidinic site) lyase n=1 Tax=Desulfurivibrio sp. D14AmB TaxID=3374370 RepID=UPI00376EDE4B